MLLERVELTASGRPALQQAEVEVVILDKVDLEFEGRGGTQGALAEVYKDGYIVLTTQRVIWMDSASGPGKPGRSCWLPVHSVQRQEKKTKMAFSGTKVRLQLDVATNYEGRPVRVDGQFHRTLVLNLRCRGDGPELLMAKLQEVIRASNSRPVSTAGNAAAATATASASAAAGAGAAGQAQQANWTPAAAGPGASWPGAQQQQQQQQQQQRQAMPQFSIDAALLQQLVEMGFPRNRSARSLIATENAGCQQAIDYMLAYGDQPGMDDPLPPQPTTAPFVAAPLAPVASTGPYGGAFPSYGQPQQYGSYASAQPGAMQYPPIMASDAGPPQAYGGLGPAAAAGYSGMWQPPVPVPPTNSVPASVPASTGAAPGGPTMFGVAGIVRREEQKASDTGRSLSAAFQDLHALMGMAADMVKLAERFRGVMSQSGENEDELMDRETQLQLIAMGIPSPVTKESAGARYQVELCRQLADFLIKPLQQAGGIMTLADVYCLYNRARGTELISPEDLLQAVKMFAQLGLPLKLRNLPSGLPVVQSATHSDEEVCQVIAELVEPPIDYALGPPVTASDVAKALSISLPIAREHLLTAELRGVVCRDDGPEGVRFYHNFFRALQVGQA